MKKISLFVSYFFLAIILALGAGCAKKADDAKISSDIQTKFSEDSGLATKQLSVKAESGVVTLSGTVDTDTQREAAGRQAASISGVKTVINNLEVSNVGKPSAVAEMTPAPATQTTESAAPPAMTTPASKPKSDRPHRNSGAASKPKPEPNSGEDAGSQSAPQPASEDNMAASANTPAAQPTPPPAPPRKFILDQGTQLTVRLVDAIDSEKNQTGDTFHATLKAPLTSDGEEAVPAGADITGHMADVKSAGKFAGKSTVVLQLDSLTFGGKTYNLQTDQYTKSGSSRGKNTAEKVGAGAAIGGIIGAIAGGGKGAAIGAAAGAGVGGGVQAATKSQQIQLPSETVLNFTLQAPITVVQAAPSDSNRQKLGESQ